MVLTRSQHGDRPEEEERARPLREQTRAQRTAVPSAAAEQTAAPKPGPSGLQISELESPESPPVDTTQWRQDLEARLRRVSTRARTPDREATRPAVERRDAVMMPEKRRAVSIHSQASNTTEIRKKEAELAAFEKMKQLRLEEIRLEREMVEKRLAVDLDRIEEQSRAAGSQTGRSIAESANKVNEWLAGVQNPASAEPPRRTRFESPRREPQTPYSQRERSTSRGRAIDRLTDHLETMIRPPPRQVYELPIFSGEPCEWLTFYNSYMESTTRYRFTPFENVARLRHSLRGEARHCVQHMLASSTRPDYIIRVLKKNFGRTDLLIDRAIEELKKMPALGPSAIDLNQFAIKVMNIVSTLVDLDRKSYGANPLLIREITERLSPHLRSRWCTYAKQNIKGDESELMLMAEFLLEESDAEMEFSHARAPLRRMNVASEQRRYPDFKNVKNPQKGGFIRPHQPNNRTHVYNINQEGCLCCGGAHRTTECRKLMNMPVGARWDWARLNRVCFKCLDRRHRRDKCQSRGCDAPGCQHSHHRLLHEASPMNAPVARRTPVTPPMNWSVPQAGTSCSDVPYILQAPAPYVPRASAPCTPQQQAPPHAMNRYGGQHCATHARSVTPHVAAPRASTPKETCQATTEPEPVEFTSNTQENGVSKTILLKIVPICVSGPKGEVSTYALLDQGSTISLMDEQIADEIGAVGTPTPLHIQGIGAMSTKAESRRIVVNVRAINSFESQAITLRTVRDLGLRTQKAERAIITGFPHLADMTTACYDVAKPQILIGADNWHLMMPIQMRIGSIHEPAAMLTPLGWTLFGSLPHRAYTNQKERVYHCRFDEEINQQLKAYFSIDALGITRKVKVNPLDKRATEIFERTVQRIDGPRYEVGQLWRDDDVKLPPSYAMALRRLNNIERKMERNEDFAQAYTKQINNLIEKGYAERTEPPTNDRAWFLPHFAVTNPNKPGRYRLVFDAAATSQGKSLNDFILEGPDKLKSILGILFRFREGAYAVTADIAEMFLQIHLREEDKMSQLFLWRADRSKAPDIYKMNAMIFGAASSPFLAHSVRDRNAEDNAETYPQAVEEIRENHYMDDFVSSFRSEAEALEKSKQVAASHRAGGFTLREWNSNSSKLLDTIPEEQRSNTPASLGGDKSKKILGMKWNPEVDEIGFNTNMIRVPIEVRQLERVPTKREALSAVMSIYDPLGLIAHYVITAKIQLQRLWTLKIGWDEPLPSDEAEKFADWINKLPSIEKLRIPRHYAPTGGAERRELHVFVDGSSQAYAAVAYWRTKENGHVKVSLVAAKAKVTPTKHLSIPRIELQAALIGSRLKATILLEHRIQPEQIFMWTDSRTVLQWIRNDARRYSPYVAHRLGEIEELTDTMQWRWVPTKFNPADDGTRSDPKREIQYEDRWYHGPSFLLEDQDKWPTENPLTELENEQIQLEEIQQVTAIRKWESPLPEIGRFSNYNRLIRTTARMLQFVERLKSRRHVELNMRHIKNAEHMWLQQAQREDFPEELRALSRGETVNIKSRIYKLDPFIDIDGLLKMKGRIDAAPVALNKRPVILDGRNSFVRLFIQREHERAAHANNERVINDIRQQCWILRLRPTVRAVANACRTCILRRTQPRTPALGDLPQERIEPYHRAFTYAAVDYFGPMWVAIGRRREKRWVALFTCLTTRAVHLELVHSLSTDSAVMALRRMAARRGWPRVMWSDNATNFRSADLELQAAYKEWLPILQDYGLQTNLEWRFIAPGAPNQGGAWERMVRSVKVALAATLHTRTPKEEVLTTLLAEAEYTVNSRPLTHVSVDPRDEEALTPNHFLLGGPAAVPLTGPCEEADRRTWRASQALANHFWARWVKEYLPTLAPRQSSSDHTRQVQVGDYVLIADPTLPRNVWPRGIIVATHPGPDGAVRNVEVNTKGGVFRRPVTRLAVLPMQPDADAGARRGESVADSDDRPKP